MQKNDRPISISRVKIIETGELDLSGPFSESRMCFFPHKETDSFLMNNKCVQAKYRYLQCFFATIERTNV